MKLKLSKNMQSCIKEMQDHAEKVYKDLPNSKVLKIRKKPTKKKTFEFHIIKLRVGLVSVLYLLN